MEQPETGGVLYIEDNRLLRRAISSFIAEEEVHCFTPTDLDQLPALLQTHEPRLALLDGDIRGLDHDRLRFGVDCLAVLENAAPLVRREQILKQGRLDRGQLMAVMLTGGIQGEGVLARTRKALLEGQLTGVLMKNMDFSELFKFIGEFKEGGDFQEALRILRELTFNRDVLNMLAISDQEMEIAWPESR